MREQFEEWYGENYSTYALQSWGGSRYANLDTQLAWEAWRTAYNIGWADGVAAHD